VFCHRIELRLNSASQPVSNVALAAVYLRLLAQSHVLAVPLLMEINLMEAIHSANDALSSQALLNKSLKDVLYALDSAMAAVQEQISSTNEPNCLIRFEVENSESMSISRKLKDSCQQIRFVL
jgi:hypothetical protein